MWLAELILGYLEVLLSWPVIALVLGVIALRWLHQPIADFLRRNIEVEGYGIRLKAADPSQQRKEAQDAIQPQSEDALLKWVCENPERVVTDYQRLFNGYWFERAYNLIFGTQLELLEHLESRGGAGEKYINLIPYFQEYVKRSGHSKRQMADYLGFLRDLLFLEYFVHDGEQHARLTPFGADFLSYLRAQFGESYKGKPW
jgi:hypothetical protein